MKIGLKVWKYFGVAREAWQQLRAASKQIDDLQKRVAELEKRLERCPGEACPHCGVLEYRVDAVSPAGFGDRWYDMKCQQCGFADRRYIPKER